MKENQKSLGVGSAMSGRESGVADKKISAVKSDVPTRRKNIFDVIKRRHVPLLLEDSNPGGHAVF